MGGQGPAGPVQAHARRPGPQAEDHRGLADLEPLPLGEPDQLSVDVAQGGEGLADGSRLVGAAGVRRRWHGLGIRPGEPGVLALGAAPVPAVALRCEQYPSRGAEQPGPPQLRLG